MIENEGYYKFYDKDEDFKIDLWLFLKDMKPKLKKDEFNKIVYFWNEISINRKIYWDVEPNMRLGMMLDDLIDFLDNKYIKK